MLFSSLQETSVHTLWSPSVATLDKRSARRQARRAKALADGLDRIAADARTSSAWTAPSHQALVRPQVALACEETLTELAARLRSGLIDATTIGQIDEFVTRGSSSPLYGTHVAAARFEALRLLDLSDN